MFLRLCLIVAVAFQPLLGWWCPPDARSSCDAGQSCCAPPGEGSGSCCGQPASPADGAPATCCEDPEPSGDEAPFSCDPQGDLACKLCNALCRTLCEQGPPAPMAPTRAAVPRPPKPILASRSYTRPIWPRPASIAISLGARRPVTCLSGHDRLALHCTWLI